MGLWGGIVRAVKAVPEGLYGRICTLFALSVKDLERKVERDGYSPRLVLHNSINYIMPYIIWYYTIT